MSWRSPLIVPMTAVCSGLTPAAVRTGSRIAVASFMARALMSISGTKISLHWNFAPMTSIALVIASRTDRGSIPSATASRVIAVAVARSPASMAAVRADRSAMVDAPFAWGEELHPERIAPGQEVRRGWQDGPANGDERPPMPAHRFDLLSMRFPSRPR